MFDTLPETIIITLVIVLTFGMFGAFFFVLNKGSESHDDKLWNNGHCDVCGGAWQYEQAVGHMSFTSYIYVCNGCGKRIEIYEVR